MVEKNPVADKHPIALSKHDGHMMGKYLGACVGAPWMESSFFGLRASIRLSEHFAAGGLIESRALAELARRFEKANCSKAGNV
jgi:hypothetical protein